MTDLRGWLERIDLGKYAGLFEDNEVDLDVLPELDEHDLEKLGLPLGPRKKILKVLRTADEPDSPPEEEPGPIDPAAGAERRQLTVMFADLAGSTELSRKLDPEDLREINLAYQSAASSIIGDFEGYVAKFLGDGVLAYFGYPLAHEDDAERALHAGLQLCEKVQALETAVPLSVRIGIASGLVVVGDLVGEGAARESAVVGETPNLAARLQTIAEPDTVVLSEATRRLVGGRFELDDLGAFALKGINEPTKAYRAVGARRISRFEAASERGLSPIIGRDEELGMIMRRWQSAGQSSGQAVLLTAEAGVGKSRIVRAVQDAVNKGPNNRVPLYCSPYHQNSSLHPAIEWLRAVCQIGAEPDERQHLSKLETLLDRLAIDHNDALPLLAELLSVPDSADGRQLNLTAEAKRAHTLDLLLDILCPAAADRPTLLIVEDAHWIDASTEDLLTHLVNRIRHRKVLALVTFRPEYNAPWRGSSNVTALALNNLPGSDSAALIREIVKGTDVPENVIDDIVRRADGVPLFVEEVTASFVESGFIDGLDSNSGDAAVPASLKDLLMARLDRLGPAKETAQLASVIGRTFQFDLLSDVSEFSEDDLRETIASLVRSGLVLGNQGSASGFEFKHALVRDAAYGSLLKSKRREFHGRIADCLRRQAPEAPAFELLAGHYEEAGKTEEAAKYWRLGGEYALARFAHVEAISGFRRAIAAARRIPDDPEWARFELETLRQLGPSLMFVEGQGAAEVEDIYSRSLELGEQLGDDAAVFTSAWGLWRNHFGRSDMPTAQNYALICRKSSAGANDRIRDIGTAFALGATSLFSGDCRSAAEHLAVSQSLYQEIDDKDALAVFGQDPGLSSAGYFSWARWLMGYPDEAVAPCTEGIELARITGKPVLIAVTTGFAGMTHLLRGEFGKVFEYGQECASICEELGFRQWAAMSNIILGYAYSAQGETDKGASLMKSGIEEKEAITSLIALPWFCSLAAEVYLAAGRASDAGRIAEHGIDLSSRGGERLFESENLRLLAVLHAREPGRNPTETDRMFEASASLARQQGARSLELRTRHSQAQHLFNAGRRDEARSILVPAWQSFTEGFETHDLRQAAMLLSEID